jgi:hypothetical protein
MTGPNSIRGNYENVAAVVVALEAAGVEFPENGGGPSVRDSETGEPRPVVNQKLRRAPGRPRAGRRASGLLRAAGDRCRTPWKAFFRGKRLMLCKVLGVRFASSALGGVARALGVGAQA